MTKEQNKNLNPSELRKRRRFLREENKKFSETPVPVPCRPDVGHRIRIAVYRSKNFLVQVFDEPHASVVRMTVNRTELDDTGNWKDGITWDDLQYLKQACGYGDRLAVEIFPPSGEVVNVANMRHLWIFPAGDNRINFAWKQSAQRART